MLSKETTLFRFRKIIEYIDLSTYSNCERSERNKEKDRDKERDKER